MKPAAPCIEEMRRRFSYDPETGRIERRVRSGNAPAGAQAERLNRGYWVVRVPPSSEIAAHRLGWALHYGTWPAHDLDHINGVKTDNRLCNLRDVPRLINLQNRRTASVNSTTGLLGVSPSRQRDGYFRADIHIKRKQILLGHFPTKEMAYQAYLTAKRSMHEGCTL